MNLSQFKRPALALALVLGTLSFGATTASATVITFDGLPGGTGDVLSAYTESGFTVQPLSGDWKEAHAFGNALPSIYVEDFSGTPFGTLSVTDAGNLFKFNALDLESSPGAIGYEISGWRNGVSQFSITNALLGSPAFTTISSLSSLQIDTLRIDISAGGTGSFNVDNINVSPVPEPETYGLMLAGLGLLGCVARRKAKK